MSTCTEHVVRPREWPLPEPLHGGVAEAFLRCENCGVHVVRHNTHHDGVTVIPPEAS